MVRRGVYAEGVREKGERKKKSHREGLNQIYSFDKEGRWPFWLTPCDVPSGGVCGGASKVE